MQSIDFLIDKDYHYHCKADKLVVAYFRYCSPSSDSKLINHFTHILKRSLSFLLKEWQIPSHDLPFFHLNLGIHILKEMI